MGAGRTLALVALAPALAVALGLAACSRGSADAPPANLVLIVVDTLRADHVHDPAGRVHTPNIDALAADGVDFPLAFSHAAMTLPSHTALFSSRRPDTSGIVLNAQRVPADLPLLAEHLARESYLTSAVVSIWTLGTPDRAWGIERGFARYDRDFIGYLPAAPETERRLGPRLDELGASDRPFFLFAHYSDPHTPYNVHDGSVTRVAEYVLNGEVRETLPLSNMTAGTFEFELPPGESVFELRSATPFRCKIDDIELDERVLESLPPRPGDATPGGRGSSTYRRLVSRWRNTSDAPTTFRVRLWLAEEPAQDEKPARYAGEVEFVDRHVGALIAELKRRGLYDDSLIVFTSDHGEAFGEHGWWGHKENLFDEQIHVPLIVKPPAGHASRAALERARDGIVTHVDLVPTLLDILGLPGLSGQEGRSLLADHRERVVLAATHLELRGEDLVALRDKHTKLVYHRLEDRFEMYDLAADPNERVDVFGERGAERAAWQAELRAAAARLAAIDHEALAAERTPEDQANLGDTGYLGGDEPPSAPGSR